MHFTFYIIKIKKCILSTKQIITVITKIQRKEKYNTIIIRGYKMNVFYLISIILGVAFQNIIKKPYTEKTSGKGVYFFSLLTSLAAMLFFIITSRGFEWNEKLLLYAVLFALSYATTTVSGVIAVTCGSLSITSLIISYSPMIPTMYGLIFLKDPIGGGSLPGLALLIISLFLMNQKKTASPITFKWIICVFLAFAGNGMCSVFQNMQQDAFDGAYKNEFMILSLAIVVVILSIFVITKERKEIKAINVAGLSALSCGIANGIVNLFVMILSNTMPISLMFSMISAGGIIITYLFSRFFYKEKLTKKQFVGFVIGIVSVVFLNL